MDFGSLDETPAEIIARTEDKLTNIKLEREQIEAQMQNATQSQKWDLQNRLRMIVDSERATLLKLKRAQLEQASNNPIQQEALTAEIAELERGGY